jgi:imidazolonepropionase-like amidohydrolase
MKLLTHALIFDGENETLIEDGSVLIEGDTIREVGAGTIKAEAAEVIDCGGRFLMPGLLDLHFHAYSATFDLHVLDRMPKPLLAAHAFKHLRDALARGFTTVRDPGGGEIGLSLAIDKMLVDGPRFLYGGKALSQTGGHGDIRPAHQEDICACEYSGTICRVVDGADEIRKVCRDELRKGADHIKVFISGGVASPTDPMWMSGFTDEELLAAVQEAQRRRKYVVAHCHTDDGAAKCVQVGIRSIDHATNISAETARLIAASNTTYTVPTLAVVHQVLDHGTRTGMAPESVAKMQGVLQQMLTSIENCQRAGVRVGLGTDIFGTDWHELQSSEFRYRVAVDKPIDILRSATSINAEIVQRKGELGVIAPGAKADLILLDTSPLQDITVFERWRSEMPLVMKGGALKRHTLN